MVKITINSEKIIVLVVIILAVVLCITFRNSSGSEATTKVVEKHTVDTLTIVRTDTIVRYEPQYITQKVIKHDTLYVTKDSIVYLPITQRFYSEKGVYDVWISGYEPKLDSIKTYRQREIVTIDHFVEREVEKNKYELYLYGGINAIQKDLIPHVGVSLVTPKKVYYGLDLGVYNKQIVYGVNVGFKLF